MEPEVLAVFEQVRDNPSYLRRDSAEVLIADSLVAEGFMEVDHWNDAMEPMFVLTLAGEELLRGL